MVLAGCSFLPVLDPHYPLVGGYRLQADVDGKIFLAHSSLRTATVADLPPQITHAGVIGSRAVVFHQPTDTTMLPGWYLIGPEATMLSGPYNDQVIRDLIAPDQFVTAAVEEIWKR